MMVSSAQVYFSEKSTFEVLQGKAPYVKQTFNKEFTKNNGVVSYFTEGNGITTYYSGNDGLCAI